MAQGRVITYEQVVAAGSRLFHRTGGFDMEELAQAANISRATLYRVAGSRDKVLGDVLWRQGSRVLERITASTLGRGVDRLIAISERFHRELRSYPPLLTFLRDDPATAFRVLLTAEPGVHSRFVEQWRTLLDELVAAGELVLPMSPSDAAFVFVRIGESLLYSDLFGDREPDLDLASRVQRALLRT
ncbi:MAG: Transcriptional regulator, TetR family [Frankiales bacterium]|nr:Transcriptional regulator, TetR family [Frankiales bacterium]